MRYLKEDTRDCWLGNATTPCLCVRQISVQTQLFELAISKYLPPDVQRLAKQIAIINQNNVTFQLIFNRMKMHNRIGLFTTSFDDHPVNFEITALV